MITSPKTLSVNLRLIHFFFAVFNLKRKMVLWMLLEISVELLKKILMLFLIIRPQKSSFPFIISPQPQYQVILHTIHIIDTCTNCNLSNYSYQCPLNSIIILIHTILFPRCCWSNIAESRDNPRRAQYLLENIIIDGCIFGIASLPLFLSRPTGDLGISGPFFWLWGSVGIDIVSWGLVLLCDSEYWIMGAASDPFFFCTCEAIESWKRCSTLRSTFRVLPVPCLYTVAWRKMLIRTPLSCCLAYIGF